MGKWQTELDTTYKNQEVSLFPASVHKAHINRRAQRHSKHKTETTQKIHKWSAALERSVECFTGGLKPVSRRQPPPFILMWTSTYLGMLQNTTAKRSALSQQVTTRPQGTDTTAQHTPMWSITNKNDTQRSTKTCFCDTNSIIQDSLVSEGAIPASDQFGGSKADIPDYIIAVLNVLRHGMQPILLHL